MTFPKDIIEKVIEGIEFAEEQTLTNFDNKNVDQEDPITSRLATRIQDETNRILRQSIYNGIWKCDVKELSNKGANSLEKEFGFDFGITIRDVGFIKTLVIQNKMGGNSTGSLKKQIYNMSKISPKDKGYVGLIETDGIYLSSGIEVELNGFDLHKIRICCAYQDYLNCF